MAGALADVMQDQAQKIQSRQDVEAQRKKRKRPSPIRWVALVLLSAVLAYIWLGSPTWLESGPAPIPPALAEAGLRMEVFQQAVVVNQFLEQRGRLPQDISETGARASDVIFTPLNAQTFRLELSTPLGEVEYVSSQPLDEFLGNSFEVIRQGG